MYFKITHKLGVGFINISPDFQQYLLQTDTRYRQKVTKLPLFDTQKTSTWNDDQKKYFAGVFYHIRGYFIDFMWYLANFAHDPKIKKIILQNINEELGVKNKTSHEDLYGRFAHECQIDIHDEILHKTHYLPFAKQFNQTHLDWLTKHTPQGQFAAFAAYERLDNIDYEYLNELALSLKVSDEALVFFKIHVYVEHFKPTLEVLLKTWATSPQTVKEAFEFIYSHQYQMWRQLSNIMTNSGLNQFSGISG